MRNMVYPWCAPLSLCVQVGIFGVYHVLWKLEELGSTDVELKVANVEIFPPCHKIFRARHVVT